MKQTLSIILLLISPIFAQSEVLTNAEIVEMTKVGLSQKVILEKIKSSVCEFDASAKSLIELKKAGVDDEVISELLKNLKSSAKKLLKMKKSRKNLSTIPKVSLIKN
ncbi:MAG: hypothetical protein HC846_02170 [Blastocatellia bacterium]|nr:hypothetical protein [Blastocatellia bacterium]